MKPWKRPFLFPFFVLAAAAAIAAFGAVVMLLWNAILPALTGWGTLSWLQAVGLLVLSRILFGGFRSGRGGRHAWQQRRHWRERWANLTDEERAALKQRWQQRCGRWGAQAPQQA
jgi:hypothetical protein